MRFSERNKFQIKYIQRDSIDIALRNRIINYIKHFDESVFKYILDRMGIETALNDSFYDIHNKDNLKILLNMLRKCEWWEMYDAIEFLLDYLDEDDIEFFKEISNDINKILQEEQSGYRIINGLVIAITDDQEIKSIEESMDTEFNSVNTHLTKALQLYSDRQAPDYENSIKESISAVEAMCCIINGTSDTLGKALKKLKDNGIEIHNSLEEAFRKLYGYTSDTHSIRHGGIDFKNASEEDAKYMLVSCSAFINYLKVKYSKIGGQQ